MRLNRLPRVTTKNHALQHCGDGAFNRAGDGLKDFRRNANRVHRHRHADVAGLFERRHVAGATPNAFLNARENAASES